MPGEHDASLDAGEAYKEFFGAPHCTFDHKGVHFIALDNVSDPGAKLGDEQLAWLAADLKQRKPDDRIVVLTHRPLFALQPQWDWTTADGAKAIELLMPFKNVVVFYGHIHQEHHHMTRPHRPSCRQLPDLRPAGAGLAGQARAACLRRGDSGQGSGHARRRGGRQGYAGRTAGDQELSHAAQDSGRAAGRQRAGAAARLARATPPAEMRISAKKFEFHPDKVTAKGRPAGGAGADLGGPHPRLQDAGLRSCAPTS